MSRRALAAVAAAIFLAACSSGPSRHLSAAEQDLQAKALDPRVTTIRLADFVQADWDRVAFFGPCQPPEVIQAAIGVPWPDSTKLERTPYCGDIDLTRYLLVFARDSEVVGWLLVNADRNAPAVVIDSADPTVMPREKAVFLIERGARVPKLRFASP